MGCCQSHASTEFQTFARECTRNNDFTLGALWHASDLYDAIPAPNIRDRIAWRNLYVKVHPGLTSSLQARLLALDIESRGWSEMTGSPPPRGPPPSPGS